LPVSVPGPVGANGVGAGVVGVGVRLGRAGGDVVVAGVLAGVAFAGSAVIEADVDGLALANVAAALAAGSAAGSAEVAADEAGGELVAGTDAGANNAREAGSVVSTAA